MRVYLDFNASAPLRSEAMAAMAAASAPGIANPSSQHAEGRRARSILEESRAVVAQALGASPSEIAFSSGGTEANRLAILGIVAARRSVGGTLPPGARALVGAVEHPSVRDLVRQLEREEGLRVDWIPAGEDGRCRSSEAAALVGEETLFVSLQHSNNETGVIHDLAPLAAACRPRGVPLHCDAVQSMGKVSFSPEALGADVVTVSSHKIGGPSGVGALWKRAGARFRAPFAGGPQEYGVRPGTEAVALAAGFAAAAALLSAEGEPALGPLRERLWQGIVRSIPGAQRNGDPRCALPNTLNVAFPGAAAELLLIRLDLEGVAASHGAACASGARTPSHVLEAMGLSGERVASSVRFSLGWSTTEAEIDFAIERITLAARAVAGGSRSPARSP